jgi:hypothetical protein
MRRFVIAALAIAALAMPAAAMAQATVNTEGLSEQQVLELQQAAATARANGSTPEATAAKVSQYVEIGKGVGQGLGTAAKELNIAVNDFAKSPVGQVTMALIIYKVVGAKLIGVLGSIIWFSIMLPLWTVYFTKTCYANKVEITYDPATGKRTGKKVTPPDPDDGAIAGYRLMFLVVLAVISVSGFVMAFGG